jgi:8-oxo-dGTP pyrophosphatase MutT (NUDIX family)
MATKKRSLQFGALPYRIDADGGVSIVLVTSRGTGRWIIPKGWPMRLKLPHEAAAREALEEAGVVGKAKRKAIGAYEYDKFADDGSFARLRVEVFPMVVERLADSWPEVGERQRRWFTQGEAADRVDEPDLAALLRGFRPRLPRSREKLVDGEERGLHGQDDDARNDGDRKNRTHKAHKGP